VRDASHGPSAGFPSAVCAAPSSEVARLGDHPGSLQIRARGGKSDFVTGPPRGIVPGGRGGSLCATPARPPAGAAMPRGARRRGGGRGGGRCSPAGFGVSVRGAVVVRGAGGGAGRGISISEIQSCTSSVTYHNFKMRRELRSPGQGRGGGRPGCLPPRGPARRGVPRRRTPRARRRPPAAVARARSARGRRRGLLAR